MNKSNEKEFFTVTPYGMKKEEQHSYTETFFNFLDASSWIDWYIWNYSDKDYSLKSLSIVYEKDNAYKASIVFTKNQMELF